MYHIKNEKILIIGATGQIGSELSMELRSRYGNDNVVVGYIHGSEPKGILKESGPCEVVDVTDGEMIASVVEKYHIDTIYNLAALLSVVAESKPKLAWKIGIDGLWNVLEVAREKDAPYSRRVPSVPSARPPRTWGLLRTPYRGPGQCTESPRLRPSS